MRLYHLPPSRSTRVLWLLEEIGEPYDVTVMKGEDRKTDEHRLRHPLGACRCSKTTTDFSSSPQRSACSSPTRIPTRS
jgi:hypothetical protein